MDAPEPSPTLAPKLNTSQLKLLLNIFITFFEIDIISDNNLIIPEYIIDIRNKSKKTIELIEYFEKLKNLDDLTKDKKIIDIKKRKKTYRKRKFYKKTK